MILPLFIGKEAARNPAAGQAASLRAIASRIAMFWCNPYRRG
ncbi:hypothetical protein I603_0558 [Erythrobacter dokdonensis DSW-74]|uniref:Uncharacterized protein n=1 Tax=Erythrobacter dokdonensis DSW-74 TaxID=1300349 RepID=A0A1A7BLT1_9SPHN|nr:hypothetical protein I603_0558 [Erythrobacter dokdonensis DSW-74]